MIWPLSAASLALAGLAGLTGTRAARRERAAVAAAPPEGRFVTVEGRRLHAVVAGEGPDLVLIHGSSGSTRDYTFRFLEAVKRRYRTFVIDRPGLGFSDELPEGSETIFDQARLLSAAAAALGATRPIVLGQSYGGAVALAWALDRPAAAVVTVGGVSRAWEPGLPLYYRLISPPLGQRLLVPLIAAWLPRAEVRRRIADVFAPQRMPAGYDLWLDPGLVTRRAVLRANARQRARLKPEVAEMQARYGELRLPIELVHGDADTTVPIAVHARPFAAEVPSAHLTELPGIGHMPHHVAEAAVLDAIDRAARRAALR